jgi:hypothetical protein
MTRTKQDLNVFVTEVAMPRGNAHDQLFGFPGIRRIQGRAARLSQYNPADDLFDHRAVEPSCGTHSVDPCCLMALS